MEEGLSLTIIGMHHNLWETRAHQISDLELCCCRLQLGSAGNFAWLISVCHFPLLTSRSRVFRPCVWWCLCGNKSSEACFTPPNVGRASCAVSGNLCRIWVNVNGMGRLVAVKIGVLRFDKPHRQGNPVQLTYSHNWVQVAIPTRLW